MTANWPLRRILFWGVIIGIFLWVVRDPSGAGHTASNFANTVMSWCERAVTAVVTFLNGVFK